MFLISQADFRFGSFGRQILKFGKKHRIFVILKEILKNKEFIESILSIDSFQELSHYLLFVKELFFLFNASYVDTVIQFAIKAKAIKQKIFKSTVKDFLKLFKTFPNPINATRFLLIKNLFSSSSFTGVITLKL